MTVREFPRVEGLLLPDHILEVFDHLRGLTCLLEGRLKKLTQLLWTRRVGFNTDAEEGCYLSSFR